MVYLRVHFRIHSGDIVDQHTHTRTVLLRPEGETLRHLRTLQHGPPAPAAPAGPTGPTGPMLFQPGSAGNAIQTVRAAPHQPVSFMRQTLQVPIQQNQQQQRPGPPYNPNPGLGATVIQQVACII